MSDADVKPAKKRRKAIDRGWSADKGDDNLVMRDRGYRAPVKPEKVADLTDDAILQVILLSLASKSNTPPEAFAGRRYDFTPTPDCAATVGFVAALHRGDHTWNSPLFWALLGEPAWWAVRKDARERFREQNPTGSLDAEHDAINAAVRAAIEPHLPPYLKGA